MKSMPFYGKIKDGIWRFTAEKIFAAYCRLQKDGDYTLTLSKTVAGKTNEQLGYFHAVIVPVVFKQMLDYGNDTIGFTVKDKFKEIPMTEETVVQLLKQVWANNKGCEVKSKADMSIEECSELIDISIRWAEQYLGCNIPPPEKTLT
jgi:hypothetical protein